MPTSRLNRRKNKTSVIIVTIALIGLSLWVPALIPAWIALFAFLLYGKHFIQTLCQSVSSYSKRCIQSISDYGTHFIHAFKQQFMAFDPLSQVILALAGIVLFGFIGGYLVAWCGAHCIPGTITGLISALGMVASVVLFPSIIASLLIEWKKFCISTLPSEEQSLGNALYGLVIITTLTVFLTQISFASILGLSATIPLAITLSGLLKISRQNTQTYVQNTPGLPVSADTVEDTPSAERVLDQTSKQHKMPGEKITPKNK